MSPAPAPEPETIEVTVKLYASLGRHLPAGAVDNAVRIRVAAGSTPDAIISRLGVPREHCHLVLINGDFVPPGERTRRPLAADDTLAIWPPIAGGSESAQAVIIDKEMGVSHREFFRILPRALAGVPHAVNGNRIVAGTPARRIDITLADEDRRRIGLLTLPVTRVRLRFEGYDRDEAQAVLAAFDRAFQRGGG